MPADHREKQLAVVSFILDDEGVAVTGDRTHYGKFSFVSATNDVAEHPFFQNDIVTKKIVKE